MKKNSLVFAVAMSSLLAVSASAANDAVVLKQARELQLAKKYDEAIKLYENGIKSGATERLYVDYAALLINLKKYKECDEMLSKAIAAFPDSLRIKNALGQAKYKSGNLSGASSLFSQVIGKDPNNNYAKTMLDTIRKEKLAADSPVAQFNTSSDSGKSDENIDFSDEVVGGPLTFKVSNALSKEEQEELAKKLYTQMMALDKWETDDFIKLHKQVIEKCPSTDRAQESCWRLSNLYLMGVEPAEYDHCVAVLEHLLKQYPDTPLMPDAKNRLLIVCQKNEDYTRVCALYKELFERDPEPSDKVFMNRALDYANALVAVGKYDEAKALYKQVIEKDNNNNSLPARAAKRKLSQL